MIRQLVDRSTSLVRRLPARQLCAVGDQILLSGANFLAALVVMRAAGVEQFGIYSFMLAVANFVHGVAMSLITGQMMLTVSTSRPLARRSLFRSTVGILLTGYACLAVVVLVVTGALDGSGRASGYTAEVWLTLLCATCLSLFDLFKRYLYVNDQQPRSLAYTLGYVVLFATVLGYVLWSVPRESVVVVVLAGLAATLALGALSNVYCLQAIRTAKPLGPTGARRLFARLLKQGRYSVGGTLVTWVQNQSMTPFLMWASGPTVVGVFNIARLLVTPIQVVNTGLSNGLVPSLRRLVRVEGKRALALRIRTVYFANLAFLCSYIALLAVAWSFGWLERLIPEFERVLPYLWVWIGITFAMLYRTWITQFFVALIDFELLLKVSTVGAIVTFTGMLVSHYVVGDDRYTVGMILLGELVLILLLARARSASVAGN